MTTSTSTSTRYRSRTPGPGGEELRRSVVGGGLGSSSDCIYSLGESLNGLDLCRCPSPPFNNTGGENSSGGGGGPGADVWTAGLKRYGGTEFDTYCLQQGLSRSKSPRSHNLSANRQGFLK